MYGSSAASPGGLPEKPPSICATLRRYSKIKRIIFQFVLLLFLIQIIFKSQIYQKLYHTKS